MLTSCNELQNQQMIFCFSESTFKVFSNVFTYIVTVFVFTCIAGKYFVFVFIYFITTVFVFILIIIITIKGKHKSVNR